MGDLSKNFSRAEFTCRCGCGHDRVQPELINIFQIVRDRFGPIQITSGCRCVRHNLGQGGQPNSAHLDGWAADIGCTISLSRHILVQRLIESGVERIGIGKGFIHIDKDPKKIKPSLWTY